MTDQGKFDAATKKILSVSKPVPSPRLPRPCRFLELRFAQLAGDLRMGQLLHRPVIPACLALAFPLRLDLVGDQALVALSPVECN